MKDRRPVHLNLFKIHFPVMAIVSILHRISGVILFFAIPIVLWVLGQSLASRDSFRAIQILLQGGFCRFLLWGLLSAFLYHLIAGIRHLAMDVGYGEGLPQGKINAHAVWILTVIVSLAIGVWLW